TVAGGALPVCQAYVTKLIIDGILHSIKGGLSPADGLRSILPYVLLELFFYILGNINGQVRQLCDKLLDHRLGHLINTRIMRKALSLDARYFEDPEFYDKMQQARRQSEYRAMGIVRAGFLLAQNFVTLTSFAVVLFAFNWVVAGVLFFAAI